MRKIFLFAFAAILLSATVCFAGIIPSDGIGTPDDKNIYGKKYIQDWDEPWDQADLLLFSTHADDEHLFFAGVLPHAAANGIRAQVVFITNHNNHKIRETECLDGLWAVGIRQYPVIGPFPDLYSESLEEAINVYRRSGFSKEDFIAFFTENIRRFKPQVVAGHDIDGEYGHGGHMLGAESLMEAVLLAGDENYHTESIALYGPWDPPKTYLHLWPKNPVRIEIDEPLDFFKGETAFAVSQYGFSFHKSQHQWYFYRWLNGTEASPITASRQIKNYPPGKFGLYRSTVGEDPENAVDLYANIVLWKNRAEEEPENEPEETQPEANDYNAIMMINDTLSEISVETPALQENKKEILHGENISGSEAKPERQNFLPYLAAGAGVFLLSGFLLYSIIKKRHA